MSNLGGYQLITTAIKSVGGPKNAKRLAIAAGSGLFLAGGAVFAGGQKLYKVAVAKLDSRLGTSPVAGKIFTVTADGEDSNGLKVSVDDVIRVLELDGDAVLVELIGRDNNPYVISLNFLKSVSEFPHEAA